MKTDFSTLVAVITGASSGIGRATAIELASRGATVVLTSRDAEALKEVARACDEAGGRGVPIAADVTSEDDLAAVARHAIANHGAIDVWINNAAVALFAKFEEAPSDVYRRVMETNFFGYVHGARAALRHFRRRHRGILINIDSVTAGAPQPYTSAYVASKYAIRGLSACLRMELALDREHAIHVCNVMPASIDTPLFQHAANYTGRAAKALDPVYPPQKVGRAIAGLIARPQAELVVGAAGRFMMANARLTPRKYEKLAAIQIDRNHLQERKQPPTDGNVFRSIAPKATDGGWRRRTTITAKVRRGRWPIAMAGIAAVAALALAAAGRKS